MLQNVLMENREDKRGIHNNNDYNLVMSLLTSLYFWLYFFIGKPLRAKKKKRTIPVQGKKVEMNITYRRSPYRNPYKSTVVKLA